ncbi:unnamed protein product [Pleuronectes platessa]|uniref:Uncharacterized protein n=1 Tax=Pleuronectes platessa TaxID=8262 RepID=A0A9N7U3H3_PLEPL|nr:unnamed protein product [Pleuronectes platessa]
MEKKKKKKKTGAKRSYVIVPHCLNSVVPWKRTYPRFGCLDPAVELCVREEAAGAPTVFVPASTAQLHNV